MSNKDIALYKKIIFSLLFPFSVLANCFSFLCDKNKRDESGKKGNNDTISNIREEYDRHSFAVIGYSFFFLIVIYIIYIILCCIFKLEKIKIILKSPDVVYAFFKVFAKMFSISDAVLFFSILLTTGALFVSIIIAMKLKKKEVKSGEEFFEQLYMHINYLKHMSATERELYIISPNINIGIGQDYHYQMGEIIKHNENINFKFICKNIDKEYLNKYGVGEFTDVEDKHIFFKQANKHASEMLKYLYDRNDYDKVDVQKLDNIVSGLIKIMDCTNFKSIQKYDEMFKNDEREGKKVVGYLSTKECLLGRYIDYKKHNKKENVPEKEVFFRGETVTSFEFIDIVKTYMIDPEEKVIKSGEHFMDCLYKHINELNNKTLQKGSTKHELYIITPNITIGKGLKTDFSDRITEFKNIQFKFICKTIERNTLDKYPEGNLEVPDILKNKNDFLRGLDKIKNGMLIYMYERYHESQREKLEESIQVLKLILGNKNNSNIEIFQEYDKIYGKLSVGGYLSDGECVLGTYSNTNKKTGEISYNGDMIKSPGLIYLIKKDMTEKINFKNPEPTPITS